MTATVLHGDSRYWLKELADNSVDSIVTDPPYELGFMGKKWDNSGVAYSVELWAECLRVLKPGGHLLSFGGTRTYHRMTIAIEDAGFEIRDCISWMHPEGMPNSLNLSKQFDKEAGEVGEIIGYSTGFDSKSDASSRSIMSRGGSNTRVPIIAPSSPEAVKWAGWGTALRPVVEPIVVARKPFTERTLSANVRKHGVGAINIDGTRVEGKWPMNFITASKANQKERPTADDGTRHPTVKPLKLMEHLIRLVTPAGGTVLDPFAGSGATLEAAQRLGFDSIGIELTAEYLPLIQQRLGRSTP